MNIKPKFITWKKYGFRHIIFPGTEQHEDRMLYDRSWAHYVVFRTFCNQSRNQDVQISGDWNYVDWDIHDKRRPLCGTCAKGFKSLTGKDAE